MKNKFTDEDAVEFGRLYRVGNTWEFEAMGRAHSGSLQTLVEMYA
jgi:tellurium resistance protein TerD